LPHVAFDLWGPGWAECGARAELTGSGAPHYVFLFGTSANVRNCYAEGGPSSPAPLTPDGPLEAPRVFAGLCFLLRDE